MKRFANDNNIDSQQWRVNNGLACMQHVVYNLPPISIKNIYTDSKISLIGFNIVRQSERTFYTTRTLQFFCSYNIAELSFTSDVFFIYVHYVLCNETVLFLLVHKNKSFQMWTAILKLIKAIKCAIQMEEISVQSYILLMHIRYLL